MVATPAKGYRVLLAVGAALAVEAAMGAPHPPRTTLQHGPIGVVADSTEYDYGTQRLTMKKVVITQGDLRVTADRAEATGLNSDNSRWTFTNNVHISSEQLGDLRSDSATVEFRNNRLDSALATGQPAEFEQTTSKTGVLARGHADSIEYKVSTDTVRLTGSAQLQYGGTETTAPVVVYNLRDQKLQFAGTGTSGGRVHIIATPQKPGKPTLPRPPAQEGGAAPRTPPGQP